MKELFQKRPRNPLSIIGLFISLVYGCACLVFSQGMTYLKGSNERLPLIWFVVVFPLIILAVFTYLVIKHRFKLYGPSDFQNEDNFFRDTPVNDLKSSFLTEYGNGGSSETATSEAPKSNEETKSETTSSSDTTKENKVKSFQEFINIENAALDKLESIKNVSINRFQTLQLSKIGLKIQLDGMFSLNKVYHAVEVKMISNSPISPMVRKSIVKKIQEFKTAHDYFNNVIGKFKPMFVFVVSEKSVEQIKSEINLLFKNYDLDNCEIHFFNEDEINNVA